MCGDDGGGRDDGPRSPPPDVPGVNRSHGRPRVLDLGGERVLRERMERIGVDPGGIDIMAGKGRVLAVSVKDLGYAQANILKQEMLSLGGDCAYARGVVTAQKETTDVLVLGTPRQLDRLAVKLAGQPFGLAGLGEDMRRAVDEYTGPGPPRLVLPSGHEFAWGSRTYVMGVLNVTPDSFSDGGRYLDPDAAVGRAVKMAGEGADIIDVGGESTRPGAQPVGAQEEMERVVPVIGRVVKETGLPVSVDTSKSAVARAAIEAGASVVNDVTALRGDPEMAALLAAAGVPVILMHMKGTPADMQVDPSYDDVAEEVYSFLGERLEAAVRAGIREQNVLLDPGIGFGKKLGHNLTLLRCAGELRCLGRPVVVGPSRKRFIGDLTGAERGERLPGTIASVVLAASRGAHMVRVHDVAGAVQALKVADAIGRAGEGA